MPRAANKPSRDLIQWNTDTDLRTGCWNWIGSLQTQGYGQIKIEGKNWTAHRVAWTVYRGCIPDGMHVLHHCDNPRCCNPDHLYLGDRYHNMRDMHARGRRVNNYQGKRKLTDDQRQKIRSSQKSTKQLSIEYGVTLTHIRWLKKTAA